MGFGFVPKPVEEVLIAAPASIGGHVHQERDQQLRRQRPAARETLAAELEVTCIGALELRGYRFEGGTKFSPACFGPSETSFVGEKKHVAVNCIRRDVRILASAWALDQRTNYVNGIGLWSAS
jgi:hypothetical protein